MVMVDNYISFASTSTTCSSSGFATYIPTGTCATKWTATSDTSWSGSIKIIPCVTYDCPEKIPAGKRTIELPDGAKLIIDDLGNYQIDGKDAKVQYRANRMRDWSPHLNASDMLADFVKYVGGLGVKQTEAPGLPLELFVNWLIIEASERDHDAVPDDVVPVGEHKRLKEMLRPRCLVCQRFIPRLHYQHRFAFCGIEHGAEYVKRRGDARLIGNPA